MEIARVNPDFRCIDWALTEAGSLRRAQPAPGISCRGLPRVIIDAEDLVNQSAQRSLLSEMGWVSQ
jgi:hypothetical protein